MNKQFEKKRKVRAWLLRLLADLEEADIEEAQSIETGRIIRLEIEWKKK